MPQKSQLLREADGDLPQNSMAMSFRITAFKTQKMDDGKNPNKILPLFISLFQLKGFEKQAKSKMGKSLCRREV